MDVTNKRRSFNIPFIKETKHALFESEKNSDGIKEKMVESDVAFSSRFMPNVKFNFENEEGKIYKHIKDVLTSIDSSLFSCKAYFYTDEDGNLFNIDSFDYKKLMIKEVSIYEAIPELVPDDVAFKVTEVVSVCASCAKRIGCSSLRELGNYPYISSCDDYEEKKKSGFTLSISEKDSKAFADALDKSFKDNMDKLVGAIGESFRKQYPISSLAKKVARSYPFNCSEVQWVIDTFGEERVRNILDMLSACGLKLSDIEPLKK